MSKCTKAPEGWHCTRGAGHTGPCAAVDDGKTDGERWYARWWTAMEDLTVAEEENLRLRQELAEADHCIEEIAKLSNPDWDEARKTPIITLDAIHDETEKVIADVLRRDRKYSEPIEKAPEE